MAELIVALDVPDRRRALELVDCLGDEVGFYKVGLELFSRWGPEAVGELRGRGKRVFLDLKLLDIPNTVSRAVRVVRELGADLLTVHATGGVRMLEAAAQAAGPENEGIRILAVTLLTSLDPGEVETVWGRQVSDTETEVIRLARLAQEAGISGVVASAMEAEPLRRALGSRALIVTPGIRLTGGDRHDQVRVATPAEAVRAGADYLVVGRPIIGHPDPRGSAARVRTAMGAA